MSCLGDENVAALLIGALESQAFTAAENHLDVCRRCRLLVATLAAKSGDQFRDGSLSAFASGDTVAGRYRVIELLGRGGMGEVYATVDSVLGEKIALKTLGSGIALDEVGVARLKAEVQVARRVTHRNVCRVFDVGFHTDARRPDGEEAPDTAIPFFTMELLPGETLRKFLRRNGPLPYPAVLRLLEQIAAGIDAAHAVGVIHRDLKCDNVMLVPEEGDTRVVITDFGLAHQLDEQALTRTPLEKHAAGTLCYMAPEQLAGDRPRPATDIYALGVVLFELLTGRLPFTPVELLGMERGTPRKPPPPLRELCGVPYAWQTAIERCLAIAPEGRFASAGELLSALRVVPARSRWRRWLVALSAATAVGALAVSATLVVGRRAPHSGVGTLAPRAIAAPVAPPVPPPTPDPAPPVPDPASPGAIATVPAPPPRVSRSASRPRAAARRSPSKRVTEAGVATPIGRDDFVDPFEPPQ